MAITAPEMGGDVALAGDVTPRRLTAAERAAVEAAAVPLLGSARWWVTVRYEPGALSGQLMMAVAYGRREATSAYALPPESLAGVQDALLAAVEAHLPAARVAAAGMAARALVAAQDRGEEV